MVVWICTLSCTENCGVCGLHSIVSSSKEVRSMSAIFPAVFLLKYLLFKSVSDVHPLASHLLKYTQRLSCVTIRELKPLIDVASQTVNNDLATIRLMIIASLYRMQLIQSVYLYLIV